MNCMKYWSKIIIGFVVLIVIDQLSKLWILFNLKGNPAIPIVPGVFELLYVENRGAAFGIMQNRQWIFLIVAAVVVVILFLILARIPRERRYIGLDICLIAIGSGAVGNMIDRIFRGYVVDFFYFKPIDFPVFNVADSCVTVGAVFLILLILFYFKDKDFDRIFRRKKQAEEKEG